LLGSLSGRKNVSNVSVVLDEEEQQELQMILTDADGEAALRFLKDMVWTQVQAARRKGLRSHLEAGQS
jgi:ABC-type phosphonate transport system ATPase subunit